MSFTQHTQHTTHNTAVEECGRTMEEPGFCQLPSISMLSSPLGYLTFSPVVFKVESNHNK
jgi:hypothetical protein